MENQVKSVKYIGDRSGFLKFAENVKIAFEKKRKEGKMTDLALFIIGTVKGEDIFEFRFARRLPGETVNRTGVRLGFFKKEILLEPILQTQWDVIKREAFAKVREHPELRIGQALFIILHENFPELADSIQGTAADPFNASEYTDPRIRRFFDKIVKQPPIVEDHEYQEIKTDKPISVVNEDNPLNEQSLIRWEFKMTGDGSFDRELNEVRVTLEYQIRFKNKIICDAPKTEKQFEALFYGLTGLKLSNH